MIAPRTVTAAYRFPPAHLVSAAEDCTDDDLFALAERALSDHGEMFALLGSSSHVRRLLDLLQRVDCDLTAEREQHLATTRLLVRELGCSVRLGAEVEILRQENEMLRAAVRTLGGEEGGQW